MESLIIPNNYKSELSLHDTQVGIKQVKDFFQQLLAKRLNLSRVSAPLFVDPSTGLNDNLNGYERPVSFDILEQDHREEALRARQVWLLLRGGHLHGYECHPPR
jgi:aspartate--ammonia ligase